MPKPSPTTVSTRAAGRAAVAAETIRKTVEEAFLKAGSSGMTDEESAERNSGHGKESTIRARRIELTKAGILFNSGRTRPTVAGVKAIVWVYHRWANATQQAEYATAHSIFQAVRPCRHCGGNYWREEPAEAGKIKTSCDNCGAFIGYRSQQRGEL